jgi:cyanate permease
MLIAMVGFFGLMLHPHSTRIILLLLTTTAIGNAYLPVFFSIPIELLSESAAAASVGMINAIGSIAGFIGPYFVGYLNTRSGSFTDGLALMMVSALGGALLVIYVPREPQSIIRQSGSTLNAQTVSNAAADI